MHRLLMFGKSLFESHPLIDSVKNAFTEEQWQLFVSLFS